MEYFINLFLQDRVVRFLVVSLLATYATHVTILPLTHELPFMLLSLVLCFAFSTSLLADAGIAVMLGHLFISSAKNYTLRLR